MTYKQAYDKIIDAYFKDEIKPLDPDFCFCGTLCDNTSEWYMPFPTDYHFPSHGYTGRELRRMEVALLYFPDGRGLLESPNEDELFERMSAALDVLKQIHIERGEVIDEIPVFIKRQLINP